MRFRTGCVSSSGSGFDIDALHGVRRAVQIEVEADVEEVLMIRRV